LLRLIEELHVELDRGHDPRKARDLGQEPSDIVVFTDDAHVVGGPGVESPGLGRLRDHALEVDSDLHGLLRDIVEEPCDLLGSGNELLQLRDVALVEGHALLEVGPTTRGHHLSSAVLVVQGVDMHLCSVHFGPSVVVPEGPERIHEGQ
jgi:hypothetical protein